MPRILCLIVFLFVFFAKQSVLLAASVTWTGTINTNWATDANWLGGLAPTAADDVTIPDVATDPVIMGGTMAVAKSVTVIINAVLTIEANNSLTINGASSTGLYNLGTVQNNGTLRIGNTANTDNYGLFNDGTFYNNTGGSLSIDRALLWSSYHNSDTFTNAGKITIGATANAGQYGLQNNTLFFNNAGGEINIDQTTVSSLWNAGGSSFTNAAKITIGGTASTYGLYNFGLFQNNAGGEIRIDRSTDYGLWNQGGTFLNAAKIIIGAVASAGKYGLENRTIFQNNPGGEIRIDRSTILNLRNFSGTFDNNAKISIQTVAGSSQHGLSNAATFNNNACATLTMLAPLLNTDNFTNSGLINLNTLEVHGSNTALVDNGVLSYPQGTPIPNVINNDFIIRPISGGPVIPNALQQGAMLSFTAGATWYLDSTLTLPAGTYNQAANTFTPLAGLRQCLTNRLYFTVTDNPNTCTRLVFTQVAYDGTPPLVFCPANIIRSADANSCNAAVLYAPPTAFDNCGTVASVLSVPPTLPSGATFPSGVTSLIWEATDAAGLTARCTFTVTIMDTQIPIISCSGNQSVGTAPNRCDANVTYDVELFNCEVMFVPKNRCDANVTYDTPTASDNCALAPDSPALQIGPASGAVFPKGQTFVVWRAVDLAGNIRTCSFRVTVNDTQAPTITCPTVAPTTVAANSCNSAAVTYSTPTATDNCTPSPTVARTGGPASGSTFTALPGRVANISRLRCGQPSISATAPRVSRRGAEWRGFLQSAAQDFLSLRPCVSLPQTLHFCFIRQGYGKHLYFKRL